MELSRSDVVGILSCVRQTQGGSYGHEGSGRVPPGTPKYHRLTEEKRIIIWTLRKEGLSLSRIAARIDATKGTVSRKLKRDRNAKKYRNAGRGRIPERVDIDERPKSVESRARIASKESDCVMSAIIGMLAGIPKGMLKTLTFDNGKEFAFFRQAEQALGIKVYFAKPYHSWERGTNENRNGVVRKVLPKGSAFDAIESQGSTDQTMLSTKRCDG